MPRCLDELRFDTTLARLPEYFYSRLAPTPFTQAAHLISFNPQVAELIGLHPDEAGWDELLDYVCGKKIWPSSDPLAMFYAGQQFGRYLQQWGDGRAILLGKIRHEDSET